MRFYVWKNVCVFVCVYQTTCAFMYVFIITFSRICTFYFYLFIFLSGHVRFHIHTPNHMCVSIYTHQTTCAFPNTHTKPHVRFQIHIPKHMCVYLCTYYNHFQTMHVWRLVIASESQGPMAGGEGGPASSPPSGHSTPTPHPTGGEGMGGTLDASPIAITTTKVR